jgi:hypothetical protein
VWPIQSYFQITEPGSSTVTPLYQKRRQSHHLVNYLLVLVSIVCLFHYLNFQGRQFKFKKMWSSSVCPSKTKNLAFSGTTCIALLGFNAFLLALRSVMEM